MPKPGACKTCEREITPESVASSKFARSLPLCAECEESALMSVRPSPQNRQHKEYETR